jgi:hypothetical protein
MSRIVALARILAIALAAFVCIGISTPSRAEVGYVRIHLFKAGYIVGVTGGSGVLYYRGRAYPLSIAGASFGAIIGFSSADLVGTVSNIRGPWDVAGVYGAGQAGVTVVGGGKVATLVNGVGAILTLEGPQVGVELSLDVGGMVVGVQ